MKAFIQSSCIIPHKSFSLSLKATTEKEDVTFVLIGMEGVTEK
jgi:hypothetical protein